MFLIPAVRLIVSEHYTLLTSSITFNGEIMSPYSCYVKKGLVCIAIMESSSHQPSFYFKYTKLNTCVLYNIHSVSFNKYTFFACFNSY